MSSNADLVYRNFFWRIETLVPTDSAIVQPARFFNLDPRRVDPSQASGVTRGFTVTWIGSDEDFGGGAPGLAQDDGLLRWATHRWRVEIYYAAQYRWDLLHRAILLDRHDLLKRLRRGHGGSSHVGYDADNPTASIGLWERHRESDEITRAESHWTYGSIWRTKIEENEG